MAFLDLRRGCAWCSGVCCGAWVRTAARARRRATTYVDSAVVAHPLVDAFLGDEALDVIIRPQATRRLDEAAALVVEHALSVELGGGSLRWNGLPRLRRVVSRPHSLCVHCVVLLLLNLSPCGLGGLRSFVVTAAGAVAVLCLVVLAVLIQPQLLPDAHLPL